jgi:hypothetical protein
MAVKAKMDFVNMSDDDLDGKSLEVITGTTDNPNYPGIADKVTDVQAARDIYMADLPVAKNGSREQKAVKNVSKGGLVTTMKALCNQVNTDTPGDYAKLISTNFTVSNPVTQRVTLEVLKKFEAVNGINPGTIEVRFRKGRGTVMVLVEYFVGDIIKEDTVWTACPNSSSKCSITGLPSGGRVWIKATSIGRRQQVIYATPITTIIL